MSHKDEARSAELLEEYMFAVSAGGQPCAEDILARCPLSQRESLRLSMIGVDFASRNDAASLVGEALVERTMARIGQIKRQRQRAAMAQSGAARGRTAPLAAADILGYLASVLRVDLPPQQATGSRAASGLRPGAVDLQPAALFRGASQAHAQAVAQRAVRARAEARASGAAVRLLDRYGDRRLPAEPRRIAEWAGIMVIEEAVEGCDGCIVMAPEGAAILVNSAVGNEDRKRFTVAHELGHHELHRDQAMFIQDVLTEIESPLVAGLEAEANAFAAELLMPSDLVGREFAAEEPSFDRAAELARLCGVSLSAAAIRLVKASDTSCALVCTVSGRIKWVTTSAQWDRYFIPLGGAPPRDSQARALLEDKPVDEEYEECLASDWAPSHHGDEDAELLELSRRLSSDYILTLLLDEAADRDD